jgi:hypothetical protein
LEFSWILAYENTSAPTEISELSDDSDKSEEVNVNSIDFFQFEW